MGEGVHLDLDGAWERDVLGLPVVDVRQWGPRLRFISRAREIEAFWTQIQLRLRPFVLYGSGDFHHLAALFIRRFDRPVTVASFDNHPDWDIRPPYWACGAWVNRALESGKASRVSVWGCGNRELAFPARFLGNGRALRSGQLEVHGWTERHDSSTCRRFDCMTRENWRRHFERFAGQLDGADVYVTVDLDCIKEEEAVTNWENGLFTAADVAWAIGHLRQGGRIVGGVVCGAWSNPVYLRWFQRFAARWDHPKLPAIDETRARAINRAALEAIWPALKLSF